MTRTFRVWAPRPRDVRLLLGGRRLALERGDDGWWSAEVGDAPPGTRYAFSLDGGPPRADPRSPWQPGGLEGPSAVVDPGAFAWTDGAWRGRDLTGAVTYELHVGTFTSEGTFDAVIPRLPHLVDLGVDAVEILPVGEFPGRRGWGYDGVLLFAPHSAYGGPDGLRRLVDACHAAGLCVLLDVVYNHFGPHGNHLAEFAPYVREGPGTTWGRTLDFDGPASREVRRFVVDNALQWLRDFHVDGLRLDAVHAITDRSREHILAELAREVRGLERATGRRRHLVAECVVEDARLLDPPAAGGFGLDAAWVDEWHHALHALLTGERSGYYARYGGFDELLRALADGWVHDGAPRRGAAPAPGRQVVCLQNHDQVGNRARGERLSALVPPRRMALATALLLTSPFAPLLFQGEEWAASAPFLYVVDLADPEAARATREGRLREFAAFGWAPSQVPDPQAESSWQASRLDWSERARPPHADVLAWHRALLALRRRLAPRLPERAEVHGSAAEEWLVVRRGGLVVAANLAAVPRAVEVPPARVALSSPPGLLADGGQIILPPDAVAVLEAEA